MHTEMRILCCWIQFKSACEKVRHHRSRETTFPFVFIATCWCCATDSLSEKSCRVFSEVRLFSYRALTRFKFDVDVEYADGSSS